MKEPEQLPTLVEAMQWLTGMARSRWTHNPYAQVILDRMKELEKRPDFTAGRDQDFRDELDCIYNDEENP